MAVVALTLLTLIVVTCWFGLHYRSLLKLRGSIDEAWSAVEAKLKLRHDIIPKLIEALKETLGPDVVARLAHSRQESSSMPGPSTGARVSCEGELSEALGLLFHELSENPAVSSSDLYIRLRDEVLSIEDEITCSKDRYNSFVVRYNTRLKVFPESFVAAKAKLVPSEEFQIGDAFARYPLRMKPTYPTPRKAFPGLEESKVD